MGNKSSQEAEKKFNFRKIVKFNQIR